VAVLTGPGCSFTAHIGSPSLRIRVRVRVRARARARATARAGAGLGLRGRGRGRVPVLAHVAAGERVKRVPTLGRVRLAARRIERAHLVRVRVRVGVGVRVGDGVRLGLRSGLRSGTKFATTKFTLLQG